MRELKFRIWDNQEKVYLSEKDIAIDNLGNVFLFEGYDDNDAERWYARILSDLDNERYIIEQFTGLRDKNGVEIYEGDIVDCVKKGPEDTDVKRATIESVINYWDSVWLYDEITIIGNIHENPELLEEK